MTLDRMTAEEAERRFDAVHYCGGTSEERAFATKRWKEAMLREAREQASVEKRERAKVAHP